MIPLLILGLVVVAGVLMFARGWSGVVIDDHPICRRCGFDLFGLPARADRCSECGADLTQPRAIREGARARRPGLITSGAILIVFAAAALALMGWARVSNFDPNPWKPLKWVVGETTATHPPATRSSAFAELRRRLNAGELSASQIDYVADVGLAHQADRSQTWAPEWGELIEALHRRGELSDDRWQRYVKQAGTFTLELRPKVRRGDPVPVRVMHGGARVAPVTAMGTPQIWQQIRYKLLTVAGSEVHVGGSTGSTLNPNGSGSSGWNEPLEKKVLDQLKDGPQPVRMVIEVKMWPYVPSTGADEKSPPIVAFPVELNGTFELIPADAQTVTLVQAPQHADAVRKAIEFRDVRHAENTDRRLALMIDIDATPVTLAHDVIARVEGREVKLGSISCHPGRGTTTNMSEKFPDLATDRIDIVLRPSVDVAHRSTDVFEVWDGELEFKDVRVARYDPATQKSR